MGNKTHSISKKKKNETIEMGEKKWQQWWISAQYGFQAKQVIVHEINRIGRWVRAVLMA